MRHARPSLATLLALLSVAALGDSLAACKDTSNGDGAKAPDAGTTDPDAGDPPGAQNTPLPNPVQMNCAMRTQLVNECNYIHSYEVNSKLSAAEKTANEVDTLFDPTPTCLELLGAMLPLDVTWDGAENAKDRRHFLRGVHTLLFHPIAVPDDSTLIWAPVATDPEPAKRPVFISAFLGHTNVQKLAPGKDVVVTKKTFNEDLLYLVRNHVPKIQRAALAKDAMQTNKGGYIYVNANWITTPIPTKINADQVAPGAPKYFVARTFFHEVRHAIANVDHTGCSNHYDTEQKQCDPALDSAYGYGFMMGHALALGGLWSRMPDKDGPLLDKTLARSQFVENCSYGVFGVNAVGAWLKTNNVGDSLCSPFSSWLDIEYAKVPTSAAGPRPPDPVVDDWTCADSKIAPSDL